MSIVIIADIKDNAVNPASFELITAAQNIAAMKSLSVHFIIPFNAINGDSYCYNEFTTWVIDYNYKHYSALHLSSAITSICKEVNAKYIIGLHTPFSIDFLPAVAIDYNAMCITQVHSFNIDESISWVRESHGGKLEQHITIDSTPIVLSLLPGSFESFKGSPCSTQNVKHVSVKKIHETYCEYVTVENKDTSLDEAEVIIGVGKGVASKENLQIIYEFAKLFPHSAVAGSKIVCDYGWLPYSKQIGITGKSIAPKVYIACGISGSSQHIAGIKQAKTIIGINIDPYAPIFNVCHYGVVADMFEFIPRFIDYAMSFRRSDSE